MLLSKRRIMKIYANFMMCLQLIKSKHTLTWINLYIIFFSTCSLKRLENMNPRKIKDKLAQIEFNKDILASSAKYDKNLHTEMNSKGAFFEYDNNTLRKTNVVSYRKMKEFEFRDNASKFYDVDDKSNQFK